MEMEMEMEMRASEDTEMGRDITPPLPPIAYSLHNSFLLSHCSSCFSPLSSSLRYPPLLPNPSSTHHVFYCSPQCSSSDSPLHFSTAEFHLLHSPSIPDDDSADLRVALRLLLSLPDSATQIDRVAGLLTNRHKLSSSGNTEILTRIRDGAREMAAARRARCGVTEDDEDDVVLEEAALCLVITNAVEVQDADGRAIGISVYDTAFSWINHNCSPNACYRFLLNFTNTESSSSGESVLRIVPAANQGDTSVCTHNQSKKGCKNYGPKIIVRSIRRIKKGEEVTIAYTDLLQPKAVRQSELWSKYQFICCCKRCDASPPTYVDLRLQEIFVSKLDSSILGCCVYIEKATDNLTDYIEQVVNDYLSVGDPESCCKRLENVLNQGFFYEQLETRKENSPLNFNVRLHPLHHLSLSSIYMTLASAYKIRASDLYALHTELDKRLRKAFAMIRTSAAYSLLLAGATHHLYCFDSSLIASVANFWTSAGESLVNLARSSLWDLFETSELPISDVSSVVKHGCPKCSLVNTFDANLSHIQALLADFENICNKFLDCITNLTQKVWSFLIRGCHYLNVVKDPIDFSWLESSNALDMEAWLGGSIGTDESSCMMVEALCHDHQRRNIFLLGVHCLLYGGFLVSVCYGQHSHLIHHISTVLCPVEHVIE
ncbi:protein SET DOMAIN GROUP 41 isoform X2 [Tripterygium wilfordii]|uniref:protein SET DOMAIN GROUP 41 isoform X2 n=1 Tax=Tripterygium wilfordii TaxID=458696 RepID=UPI0018F82EA4|nr:protein SET DOMAIN GROUP 41 isoform X2 [Tripterygium wilfordii]